MDIIAELWTNLVAGDTVASKVAQTLAAAALFAALRRSLTSLLCRGRTVQAQYTIRKGASYAMYACAFVVVGRIWFHGFESLTTYAGLLSAGIAIALQSPLVNLAGWLFIIWRKPFEVGHRVQVGDHRGDVIDQRLFMFSLLEVGNWVDAEQSTGRVLHIPNGQLFTTVLANYSQGFRYIWNEVPILITFESDWRLAKRLVQQIAGELGERLGEAAQEQLREAAKKYMIFYTHLTPVVYTSVRDSGVLLTLRYLCDPRQRRSSEEEIWEKILSAFERAERVDFAYPTQRLYANDREGKPQTRPLSVYGGAGLAARSNPPRPDSLTPPPPRSSSIPAAPGSRPGSAPRSERSKA